jgi:uncharacterized protein (TIGR02453 family)
MTGGPAPRVPDSTATDHARTDKLRPVLAHFTPALFDFLRELAANNNRDWFIANKARYEAEVRDPVLAFIGDVGPGLRVVSSHLVADPRPLGGSMIRIHRDTRFSRDKSPYRAAVEMSFGHDEVERRTPAPGYFMRLADGGAWVAGGLYRADAAALKRVRDAIVGDPQGWGRITTDGNFAPMFQERGESLKKPPPGYAAGHPFIEDLKRKSFVWYVHFSEEEACAAGFIDRYLEACGRASPFSGFLANALGIRW